MLYTPIFCQRCQYHIIHWTRSTYIEHVPWYTYPGYLLKAEIGFLPPPCFTLYRKDPHADKERAVSSFRQPRRRLVFVAERSMLLNCPLKWLHLSRIFVTMCSRRQVLLGAGLGFLYLGFCVSSGALSLPYQLPRFRASKNKVIRFALSRCICSSSDLPKLV